METNHYYNSDGEQRIVRAFNMKSRHDEGFSAQREYIVNTLANDEALLNDLLQFRQQQAQYQVQKAGHNVFSYYENVVRNKQLIYKPLNQSKHLQPRLQVQQDTLAPNKHRLNESARSRGLPTPKQQRSGNKQLQDNERI